MEEGGVGSSREEQVGGGSMWEVGAGGGAGGRREQVGGGSRWEVGAEGGSRWEEGAGAREVYRGGEEL